MAGDRFRQSFLAPRLLLLVASLLSVVPIARSAEAPTTPAAERQSLNEAKTLARQGNVAAAELAIDRANRAPANSASWHCISAQRLLRVAKESGRDGRSDVTASLAAAALRRAAEAEKRAVKPGDLGAARMLSGQIYENHVGDLAAARRSYEAAAAISPKNTLAHEAVARVRRLEAFVNDRNTTRK